MRFVGQLCLLGALVGTGYAAFACVLGWRHDHAGIRRSGLLAAAASLLGLSGVVGVLAYALVAKDFHFDYVAQYSSRLLPWHYSLSSLWVGQAGSLLLWAWMSAGLALIFRLGPSADSADASLREPAFGVLMAFCCFLVGTMVFAADPMAPSLAPPEDGMGLSPILQHPSMLVHPPIVFLGYSAWSIPFALAIVALATGQLSAAWTRAARPWALFAWTVLGAGILLGARWAYDELGWGGYWGWDPVENGSLIPWLVGTTAIHTMMAWRHRGMLKKSALALTIATFGMCNFATFLTRSGIFSSLHAFSKSPIGWLFLGLMLVISLGAGILLLLRRSQLTAERGIASLWCREAMVVISALALVSLAIVVCLGTVSTAVSDTILGHKIVVGIEYYNNALIPTGLLVLLTTAAAPLTSWGRAPSRKQAKLLLSSAAIGALVALIMARRGVREPVWLIVDGLVGFAAAALLAALWLDASSLPAGLARGVMQALRIRRRQYAGFLIHLGLFCLAIGVTASSFGSRRHELVMHVGQTIQWSGRHVRLAEIVQHELPDKQVVEARLDVRDRSARQFQLAPAQHFHLRQKEWTTEISNHTTWSGDFYTILHSGEGVDRVRLTLVFNPMMRWIWAGGWIMVIGSIAAIWPGSRSRARSVARTRTPSLSAGPRHAAKVAATILLTVLLAARPLDVAARGRYLNLGDRVGNGRTQEGPWPSG